MRTRHQFGNVLPLIVANWLVNGFFAVTDC